MRILVYTDNPETLTDLAGFVSELGGGEAYAVAVGEKEAIERHAYNVFRKVYYLAVEKVLPDQLVEVVSRIHDEVKPELVVGPASKNGNEVGARLAARKDLPMYTEITGMEQEGGELKITRQVLGGRSIAVIRASPPIVVTIPLKKYRFEGETGAPIEAIEVPEPKLALVGVEEKVREAVDIEAAEIVVGVGRGFRKKEDLGMAEKLAELLGGVVGCSRPIAADYKWLSEDRWIGISGKKIRPKLYIAIGISGAPQHMAAAMDSKIIVAINKDKNAPIFEYADYGVVADLYKLLPALIKKLEEKLKK